MIQKKLLTTFLFCLLFFSGISQDLDFWKHKIEERQKDFPDLVNKSYLYEKNKALGYNLISIQLHPCLGFEPAKNRVAGINITKDTLEITVGFGANCCSAFLGEIEITNDTLNLIYYDYGEVCFCGQCIYTLTYKIITSKPDFSIFKLNGEIIPETNQICKIEYHDTLYHANGNKQSITSRYDNDIQSIIYYDTLGISTYIDFYGDDTIINSRDMKQPRLDF